MTAANGSSYSVPQNLRDAMLALRGAGDAEKWAAGDLMAEAEAEAPAGHKTQTVKVLAGDVGIGYSTARKWLQCAATYEPGQRSLSDILTHECYAVAMYDDDPMAVLQWAVKSADDHNGVISPADRIRVYVRQRRKGEQLSALDEYRRVLDRLARDIATAQTLAGKAGVTSFKLADVAADVEALIKQAAKR